MKKSIKYLLLIFIGVFSFIPTGMALDLDSGKDWSGTGTMEAFPACSVNSSGDDCILGNSNMLSITGVEEGDTFKAYKILDVHYNTSTNVISYEFTSDFKIFLKNNSIYKNLTIDDYMALTSGSITSGSTVTNSTLDKLASLYASYIKEHSLTGTDLTTDGTTASNSFVVGTYLVLPVETLKVYSVMVGNVEVVPDTTTLSGWKTQEATIVAKKSDVSISKTLVDANDDGYVDTNGYYTYRLDITVPRYSVNATNTTFNITDEASEYIFFNIGFSDSSNISVKDGKTRLTQQNLYNGNYEINFTNSSGQTVVLFHAESHKLEFVINPQYLATTMLTIEYKAKLGEGVSANQNYDNTATLVYSNDPYGTSTETITASKAMLTCCLELTLVDKANPSKLLAGGKFDLYNSSDVKRVTLETDSTGKASFVGVSKGSYYLKQVVAPAGYKIATNNIEIDLANATLGDSTCYSVSVLAEETSSLPFTGGSGTGFYTVIGLVLILGSITGYVLYRKKQNNY